MMRSAVDFSYARPSGQELQSHSLDALGYTGNARPDTAYLSDLAAHGVGFTFVQETTSERALEGYQAGVYDAQFADARADARGYSRTATIAYVVSDGSAFVPSSGGDAIAAYGQGIAATSLRPVFFYGNRYAVDNASAGARRVAGVRLFPSWVPSTWGANRNVDALVQEANFPSPVAGTDLNSVYQPYYGTTSVPTPEDDDVKPFYITKQTDPALGIWVTDQIFKRHVQPSEWAWVQYVSSPKPAAVPIDDAWWDSLPVAGGESVAVDVAALAAALSTNLHFPTKGTVSLSP